MARMRSACIPVLCALMLLCASTPARASEYRGQITFGGFPVPGATVTATQGTKKVSVVSDPGGLYSFDDLADGPWKIEIEMQCFVKLDADVVVAPKMPPGKWELQLLPLDQLMAQSKLTQAQPTLTPALTTPQAGKKPDGSNAGPTEIPKAPDEQSEQSNDGFLVNGSVNNAATSQYSLDRAFGNRRPNSKSLYTGGFAVVLNNSALDARPYSLTGIEAPKALYDRVTGGRQRGRPTQDSAPASAWAELFCRVPVGRATRPPQQNPAWCRPTRNAGEIFPACSIRPGNPSPSTIPPPDCRSKAASSR